MSPHGEKSRVREPDLLPMSKPQPEDILNTIETVGYWTTKDERVAIHVEKLATEYKFSEDSIALIEAALSEPIPLVLDKLLYRKRQLRKQPNDKPRTEPNEPHAKPNDDPHAEESHAKSNEDPRAPNECSDDQVKAEPNTVYLGFYKIYGPTGRIYSVMPRGPKIFIVVAFGEGTQMTIYPRSHRLRLKHEPAKNGLFQLRDENTKLPDAKLISGGLAIIDVRLWWKIEKWKVILLGFMTMDEVKHWSPMPVSASFEETVGKMRTETLDFNFKFFNNA